MYSDFSSEYIRSRQTEYIHLVKLDLFSNHNWRRGSSAQFWGQALPKRYRVTLLIIQRALICCVDAPSEFSRSRLAESRANSSAVNTYRWWPASRHSSVRGSRLYVPPGQALLPIQLIKLQRNVLLVGAWFRTNDPAGLIKSLGFMNDDCVNSGTM